MIYAPSLSFHARAASFIYELGLSFTKLLQNNILRDLLNFADAKPASNEKPKTNKSSNKNTNKNTTGNNNPKKKPTKKKSTKSNEAVTQPAEQHDDVRQQTVTEETIKSDNQNDQQQEVNSQSKMQAAARQLSVTINTKVNHLKQTAKPATSSALNEVKAHPKQYALLSIITALPAIAIATIYVNPLLGTYINAMALVALVTIALMNENLRKVSISVAVLPVIHLFNLSVPQDNLLLRTVIFYSLLLLLTLTYRYLFTLEAPKKQIRLSTIIAFQLILLAVIFIGLWQYQAIQTYFPFGIDSAIITTLLFILLAIIEESYFRGLVQANALTEANKTSSIVIATTLFGFSFIGPDMPWALLLGLLFGLLLSVLYAKRRNLVINIAANMAGKLLLIGLLVAIG